MLIKGIEWDAIVQGAADVGFGVGVSKWFIIPQIIENQDSLTVVEFPDGVGRANEEDSARAFMARWKVKLTNIIITMEADGSNTGSIELTTAPLQSVIDENETPVDPSNLVPITWSSGTVVVDTLETIVPVTAFRVVRTTGTVNAYVKGV